MNEIQNFEKFGGLSAKSLQSTQNVQSSKLKYNLGVYAAPKVQSDNFALSATKYKKNIVDKTIDNFLYKYNPEGLLNKYSSVSSIEKMLELAPEVNTILQKNGVANPKPCIENLTNIKDSHVKTTVNIASALADELNLSSEDKQAVVVGAMLHDFGKIMMPKEVLDKHSLLSNSERKIIDTHSRIGYEMLKTTGVNSKVLSIVANHHTPAIQTSDPLSKIVSVADVYSALTEKRSYKESMSNEQALSIMNENVNAGKLDAKVVNALKKYLNANSSLQQAS